MQNKGEKLQTLFMLTKQVFKISGEGDFKCCSSLSSSSLISDVYADVYLYSTNSSQKRFVNDTRDDIYPQASLNTAIIFTNHALGRTNPETSD